MKTNIFKFIILLLLIFFIVLSCTLDIEPPTSMRFSASVTIKDTTAIGNDTLVANADVIMQSITYGDIYESSTNETGTAIFNDLLPDRYNILATGKRVSIAEIVIINGQLQDTSLYVESNDTLALQIIAQTSKTSALVISEIYYTGAKSIIPSYFHDQFTEIYNNSPETLYLDSLIIADVESGYIDEPLFHSSHAYMFPGDGDDYPIGPGEFIVIAQDAIDHTPNPVNSVNLLNADFEYFAPYGYNNKPTGDVDNPYVQNMVQIHHEYGNDFLYSVFNNAILLMKVEKPYEYGYDEFERILLPKDGVIDGVEYRDNVSQLDHKRIDGSIDGGLTGGIASYSTQSVERNIDRYEEGRMILMDNNNSSLDFHVNKPPTPGWVEEVTE